MTFTNAPSSPDFTATPRAPSTSHRRNATVARLVLGAAFLVFGLNGFLNFLPRPAGPVPEGAAAFGAALLRTGYMFPLVKGTEVVCGVLLVTNRFVPLGLTMLAPVLVNILAFHAFLAPGQLAIPAALVVLELYLAWAHRDAFAPMLRQRATPVSR